MIKLKFKCEVEGGLTPFVGKITRCGQQDADSPTTKGNEIRCWYDNDKGAYRGKIKNNEVLIFSEPEYNLDGDIFLFVPQRNEAQRIIRRKSRHNSLLFTEQCDQLCVMCSQPPRIVEDRWLIPLYEEAIKLADMGARIGITGGEPTLYKEELFSLLENIAVSRPDISFHILSNGQHFSKEDRPRLLNIHKSIEIVWGIPLYSSSAKVHDEIVKKPGAFKTLLENFFILASCGGSIELRTVLMKNNIFEIPYLGKFIARNINFIDLWAIMSLEPIGYAKNYKDEVFFDFSQFFAPISNGIEIARNFNVNVSLYNFPLCTVPLNYRKYCVDSISDWKKKYLKICNSCSQQEQCCGFFEWYNPDWDLAGVHPI